MTQPLTLFWAWNIVRKLGALKSKSRRATFLPPAARMAPMLLEIRLFPVPPRLEWIEIILTIVHTYETTEKSTFLPLLSFLR